MAVIQLSRVVPEAAINAPFVNAGAPTNNTTFLGVAVVGSLLKDSTNGILYQCSATNGTSTITWVKVGAET